MMYHYTMCGLDYVYLRNGYRKHDTAYGEGVSIENADALDREIAICVISSYGRLRGQEVRFIRSLLGTSQAELATRLGVKRLTVARWEKAPITPIPGPADRTLRVVAAKGLFGDKALGLIVDFFPEITDVRSGNLVMTYLPEEDDEPSLFPDCNPTNDGWKPSKAA